MGRIKSPQGCVTSEQQKTEGLKKSLKSRHEIMKGGKHKRTTMIGFFVLS